MEIKPADSESCFSWKMCGSRVSIRRTGKESFKKALHEYTMDKKCVEEPCILFSKFECVIPLSAQKYRAYLMNLYSESKKRNIGRNLRWMECSNSQNLEVQSVQGKVNVILNVKVVHGGNRCMQEKPFAR